MSESRVLVTGACGFVGRHLVADLQAAGQTVHGLDRPTAADRENAPAWLRYRRELGIGAPGQAVELADLLADERISAVYHLAGQSSAGASFADPAGTVRANLLGTLELLEALRLLAGRNATVPRLLVVGSGEEYGRAATERPCREDDPLQPVSPYGTSKAAATQLCLQYHRGFGLPVLPVRAFNHTGPGQDQRFAFPSFAAQIATIEAGRAEPLLRTGDLTPSRDFLDVRDVVTAYRTLVEGAEPGILFNVCSGSALTIEGGLKILLGLSSARIEVVRDRARLRPVEVPCLIGDPTRLRDATGWRPRHAIEDTLRDLLQAAREELS